MPMRDYIGLILSITVTGAMVWACSFDVEETLMKEFLGMPGGKFKFLTILNLVNRFFDIFL